eukprot:s6676_g4.t2
MALNLTLRAPQDESCSRWEFNNDNAGRDESHVKKLILGQLVFYRHKHDSKFGPNAAPGLSAGWRLEPGGIYRDVTLVLDLEKLRTRPGAWTDPVSVPESELYVRSGVSSPATFRHQKPGALVLFEIVSHSGSRLTSVANETGVRVVSIPCDQVDFADPSVIDQLVSQVSALPGCCLCGSLFSYGCGFKQSGYGYWKAHRTILSFLQVASVVVANGGEVVLEWPQDSSCWMLPEVQAFEDQFGLRKVSFDGCAVGLVSLSGVLQAELLRGRQALEEVLNKQAELQRSVTALCADIELRDDRPAACKLQLASKYEAPA